MVAKFQVSFFSVLGERVDAIDSLLCVGLDPHVSELGSEPTTESAVAFCRRLIESTLPFAVRVDSAFYLLHSHANMYRQHSSPMRHFSNTLEPMDTRLLLRYCSQLSCHVNS